MKKVEILVVCLIALGPFLSYGQSNTSKKELNQEWLRTNPDVIVYLPKGEHDGSSG